MLYTFSLSLQQNGCDIHQPVFELLLDIVNHYYNNIGLVQQLYINLRPLLQIELCKWIIKVPQFQCKLAKPSDWKWEKIFYIGYFNIEYYILDRKYRLTLRSAMWSNQFMLEHKQVSFQVSTIYDICWNRCFFGEQRICTFNLIRVTFQFKVFWYNYNNTHLTCKTIKLYCQSNDCVS